MKRCSGGPSFSHGGPSRIDEGGGAGGVGNEDGVGPKSVICLISCVWRLWERENVIAQLSRRRKPGRRLYSRRDILETCAARDSCGRQPQAFTLDRNAARSLRPRP